MVETLNIIKNDPWLEPYSDAIVGRHQHAIADRTVVNIKQTL